MEKRQSDYVYKLLESWFEKSESIIHRNSGNFYKSFNKTSNFIVCTAAMRAVEILRSN